LKKVLEGALGAPFIMQIITVKPVVNRFEKTAKKHLDVTVKKQM